MVSQKKIHLCLCMFSTVVSRVEQFASGSSSCEQSTLF